MNRNEEYRALLDALEETPDALDCTVDRAAARLRRTRRRHWISRPVLSCAACVCLFVLLVNLFPPFAMACGRLPVLKELAKAVAWSPSLSAAVENEYVQPVEQTAGDGDFSAKVHYVIVDRKQLSIFYTLEHDGPADGLIAGYCFDGITGWAGDSGAPVENMGELMEIDISFIETEVPSSLDLTICIYAQEEYERADQGTPLAELPFHLEFDPYFMAQGEILPVDWTFTLDGQHFTLTEAELYPTHLRLNLEDDPDNTAWLVGLDLYLENEQGERFGQSISGVTASGDTDGEGMASFWLDSPFFRDAEHLTLCIRQARWRSKDCPPVRVDLENSRAEQLPEGVRFGGAVREDDGSWTVSFIHGRGADGFMQNYFSRGFLDEQGNCHDIWEWQHTFGWLDPESGTRQDEDTTFTESLRLEDFPGGTILLPPDQNGVSDFAAPVRISIR